MLSVCRSHSRLTCKLQEATIAEMNSYQTSNFSSSEGPILMLVCDIYGFQAKNIRLVADRYAELGMGWSCMLGCPHQACSS